MVARGERLKSLVGNTLKLLDHREPVYRPRRRARKGADALKHKRAVEGIIANLAYTVLNPPETGRVAINTRNGERGRLRYESAAFGKTFRDLVYMLWQEDLLDYRRAPRRGEVTSIAPSAWFSGKVKELQIGFADFGRDADEEVILLSRNLPVADGTSDLDTRKRKERLGYDDNDTTRKYRASVRRLNEFLAASDIAFLDDGRKPVIDPYSRTLSRRFLLLPGQKDNEPRFDQGGRLFGGFWMMLDKKRRQHIRISGEPVATLDYSTMFTRLAYAELGKAPPPLTDLYAVPGLSGYRSGVKMAMNCFLFDNSPRRSSWPKKMGRGVGTDAEAETEGSAGAAYEARLPAGWGVGQTKKAILNVHPSLREAWGRALGYRLMWRESEVLTAVLEDLMEKGVPALGLHDGLLVPASKRAVALEAMARQAKAVVGVELPASEKN